MTPRTPCPICGARGWFRIANVGVQLIFWCRRKHPYLIPGESDK